MRLPSVPAGLYVEAWPPLLGVRGPGSLLAWHEHHAMHFVLAVEGALRVRTSRHGRWVTAAGVLTPPDHAHALDARGVHVLVIFFDPDSDVGEAIRPACRQTVRLVSSAERDALVRAVEEPRFISGVDAHAWARDAARTLGLSPGVSGRPLHPAVRRLLIRLRNSGLGDDASLEGLAQSVNLSPGRLMHVFTESIGIPLRPYLAWLRVQRAACAILDGFSLNDAAHLAGFSDASHMGRTFRRRLGATPSGLRRMRTSQLVRSPRD